MNLKRTLKRTGLGLLALVAALYLFVRLGGLGYVMMLFLVDEECLDKENNSRIVKAIRQKGAPGLLVLLEQGEDAQQEINCFGDTPLFVAIAEIHPDAPRDDTFEMVDLLIEHGADVNHVNKLARTPLHAATAEIDLGGNLREKAALRMVKVLLDAGADPLLETRVQLKFFPFYTHGSAYQDALTRGEFDLAAIMRDRPGHVEPRNLKELEMEGEAWLLECLKEALEKRDIRWMNRLTRKIRRRMDAGEWTGEPDPVTREFLKTP